MNPSVHAAERTTHSRATSVPMARICRLTPKTFGYMLLPFLFPAFGLATMYMFCRPSAGRPCDSVEAIFLDSQRAFTSARLEHWLVVSVGIVAFAIAMEFYARYAHRGAWHGWLYRPVHSTHHSAKTAEDVFEMNDLFGVFSFVVVFPFIAYAQTRVDSWGGAACFGAAVGISVFGTAVRICRSNNVNFNYLLCSFYSITEYSTILILLLIEYIIERLVVHTSPHLRFSRSLVLSFSTWSCTTVFTTDGSVAAHGCDESRASGELRTPTRCITIARWGLHMGFS